jgi:hypothetical protein
MNDDYVAVFNDLLTAMAVVVGATEAAGFSLEWNTRDEPTLRSVSHIRPDDATDSVRREAIAAFSSIVLPCARERKDGVVQVDGTPNPQGDQYCLVRIFSFTEFTGSAATFIVRCRTAARAQTLLDRLGHWSSAKVWRIIGWR